jgi:hypothetical protein
VFRSLAAKVVVYTFGVAALIAILEHAGGFSQILSTSFSGYGGAFTALTGHGGGRAPVAAGFVQGGRVHA